MGALRARHLLERRRWIEIGERAAIVLTGDAVLEHGQRGAAHGPVAAVVEYDGQYGKIMDGGDPMSDHRIGEHVGAIAERRDNKTVGCRKFGAQRCAESPSESARRSQREERVWLFARAMVRPQRVF